MPDLAWWQDEDEARDARYDPTLGTAGRSTTPRSEFPPALLRASELAEEAWERDREWRGRNGRAS